MTIDEAIETCKAITNQNSICPMPCMRYCEKCVKESEQFKEWLEELKEYKQKSDGWMSDEAERNLYKNAIDKCIEIVEFHKDNWDGIEWALIDMKELKEHIMKQ